MVNISKHVLEDIIIWFPLVHTNLHQLVTYNYDKSSVIQSAFAEKALRYCIAGYFRREFIFGYFEEAFLFENKFLVTALSTKINSHNKN